jgi:protein TonB
MKTNWFFPALRQPRRFGASLTSALVVVTVLLCPGNAKGQQHAVPKLTLSQVEQLVSHGVPDSTMAAQIRRHGLAFKPTPEDLKELQAKGAGPLTIQAIQPAPFGPSAGIVMGSELPPPPPPPPVAPSPSRVRISAGVAGGMLLQRIDPVYPPIARAARISGTVVLDAVISKTGSVESLHVVSGHPMLVQAALDAVRQWRYRPFLLNGMPVEVQTTVTVTFTVSN